LNGERVIKVKEHYSTGELKYEGEYLKNIKWNGIGYAGNGHKIYELKNGTGTVIEYYSNGNKYYEGEYLNGKKNGKGKIYNISGKLEYEGELLEGEKNGNGKEYSLGRLEYEGEFLNGERHGKGWWFTGEFKNGKRWNGIGKEYDFLYDVQFAAFEGEYKEGKRWNGKGEFHYDYGGMAGIKSKHYEYINGEVKN